MRSLGFILLLGTVLYTKAEFGTPYLKNARLCRPWDCVARNLGLPASLPPQGDYTNILKSFLSEDWHQAVDTAVDICYNNRPKQYVNTCTAQALLHCTLDNLIENCPVNHTRRDDACNPVGTTAGMNYMFTQSRYKDLEKNLPKEHRPAWFMRQYFDTKCCDIPTFINTTVLTECGFHTFLRYYENEPKANDTLKHYLVATKPKANKKDRRVLLPTDGEYSIDPLECCDMDDFIASSSRSECGFQLSWDGSKRFKINEQNLAPTTTVLPETTSTPVNKDIRIVPLPCDKTTCVFSKLNAISESGTVDIEALTKVLDNFTALNPSWVKAKARVMTQCLSNSRMSSEYNADCEINKVLGCVLDVFSENCPHKSKKDVCKHSRRNNTVCQISSSKYRPKNRRSVCGLPHLVDRDVLSECGVTSVSQIEYVPEAPVKKNNSIWRNDFSCKDSSPSTLCVMRDMGILNKYGFMDHFQMKDRIRSFTSSNQVWGALTELYINVFNALPMYKEYCNSPQKLMNVLDAMVMTCPISKRQNTPECAKLFNDVIRSSSTDYTNITKERLDEILEDFRRVHSSSTSSRPKVTREIKSNVRRKPVFEYGILSSKSAPKDVVIEVKPNTESSTNAPLVILPVYMRINSTSLNIARNSGPKDGIFQRPDFLLHAKARSNNTENIKWKPFLIV
ncbi:unnamed protein product [Chilo suppressalis]|uniref:Uncharacterized protein n=1 Tax=Chilo suppressalis TaxID=168631 RepID=A0ABN8B2F5_CHISP|nr:unnamed protein product [Chilo suppressalis]